MKPHVLPLVLGEEGPICLPAEKPSRRRRLPHKRANPESDSRGIYSSTPVGARGFLTRPTITLRLLPSNTRRRGT